MKTSRKKYITLIHVAQSQLGLPGEVYTDIKRALTGKESCKDMNMAELRGIYTRMKVLGFKPTKHKSAKKSGMDIAPPVHKARQIQKIEAILTNCDLPWAYADGIARRMFGIDRLRWCDTEQLLKVTAALSYHQKKVYADIKRALTGKGDLRSS